MQKRTFLTDTKVETIDLPSRIMGVILVNNTDKDAVAYSDGGDEFPCPSKVIATWSVPSTQFVRVKLLATPTNSKSLLCIVTDEPTLNSTSQLSTLSGGSSGGTTMTYGTTLPVGPADGALHCLVDNVSNPTYQWVFRYNASSASAFKWEFIGGDPLEVVIDTDESSSATAFGDLATVGPSFTSLYAGDYNCKLGFECYAGDAARNFYASMTVNGASSEVAQITSGAAGFIALIESKPIRVNGLGAGQIVKVQYRGDTATARNYRRRRLQIIPYRIG